MLRRLFFSAMLAAAFLPGAGKAAAQTAKQEQICRDDNFNDFVGQVDACSALIAGGKTANGRPASEKTLGGWYFSRALAYAILDDYERAIADYRKVPPSDTRAVRNIYPLELKLAWLRYLKEIQDEKVYPNWSTPPYDAQWKWD
jgi:hypothetical protein